MGGNVLSSLSTFGGGFTGYIVPFLFVLTIVVFFHELGHFLVARWCGIKVLAFSIGFGPEIVGFNDRHGTRWKLSAIPLGGYVKFFGDENAASVPDHRCRGRHGARRTQGQLPSQAGAGARGRRRGRPDRQFHPGDRDLRRHFHDCSASRPPSARVDTVQPGSAAAAAGFQPGDLVIAIDGSKIDSFLRHAAHRQLSAPASRSTIEVERGGVQITLKATPNLNEVKDNFGNVHRLGVLGISRSMAPATSRPRRSTRCTRCGWASRRPGSSSTGRCPIIGGVFAGREAADQLGGPIRIAQVSGQVGLPCRFRWRSLLHLAAVLSVSIGLSEPVSRPAARWRSPFVLRHRSHARPAAVRAGPGGRVPDRLRDRRDVDGFCNL